MTADPVPTSAWHRRRGVPTLAAFAIFALLAVGFFNPVFRGSTFSLIAGHSSIQYPWAAAPSHYHDAAQSDQANNVYPIQVDLNRNLRDGRFPYWSPYSFGGGPTLGNVYGVGFYPPRVAASLLVSPTWVHDLLVVLHVFLAGAAMFLLVRRLGHSWLAGMLAGIAWMFSPSWFGLALLEGSSVLAALIPLLLWFTHRAVVGRSRPDAVATAFVLALIVLGASVQPAVFCFALAAGWGLLLGVAGRDRDTTRPWRQTLRDNVKVVALFVVLGVMLCAFLVLPATAQISDSARAVVPDGVMKLQDVGLDDFAHVADGSPPLITGDNVWALTFLGLPALVAALAGLFSRRRGTGLGRTIVVVFFLLMVGTVFTEVARALVPGFAYLSPLGRLLPFFAFGAVLLAGIGVDTLRDALVRLARPELRRKVLTGFTVVAALALALEAWQLIHYDRQINPPFQPRKASMLYPKTPLIAALQGGVAQEARAGDEQRIVPVRRGAATDPFSPPPFVGETTRLFGLESAGGYLNVIPERSRILALAFSGATVDAAQQPLVGAYEAFFFAKSARFDLLRKMGVDSVVTAPKPQTDPSLKRAIRTLKADVSYSGPDGAVLQLPDTHRAFVVDGVETVPTEDAALRRYADPAFDEHRTVLLDGSDAKGERAAPSTGALAATTQIRRTGPSDRTIEVDSPRAGWLVLLDSYAKGWSAKVGGKDAELKRADFAYRAVRVPAGRSTVTMHYTTPSLRLGLGVTLLGLLLSLALLLRPLLARRRRGGPTLEEEAEPAR
ncbi:MAG: Protein of unknown function, rane YfhO [Conexibacter sp.]|nr:Protein of unknown function, rane YfhO [Conexibacter sp.]